MKRIVCCVTLLAFSTSCSANTGYEIHWPISWGDGKTVHHEDAHLTVVESNSEMQINFGTTAADLGQDLSRALSSALKVDNKSKKFRVTWDAWVFKTLTIKATVLYDRQSKTLRYFGSGDHQTPTSYEGISRKKFQVHTLMSHVDDATIHALAANDGSDTSVDTGGFTDVIKKYGALVTSAKTWEEKAKK